MPDDSHACPPADVHAAPLSNPLLDDDIASLCAAVDKTAIVAVTDARGNIVHVNSEFVRISGYSREELIGQNHRLLSSGRHGKDFWSAMYQTVVRGEVWRGQVCNRAKDGHEYWVDTAICCTFDQDGKVHRFVAVRFDISKEKAHEANLLQHREELEWAAEEQSKLVEALETSKAELEQKNAQLEKAVAAAKAATRTKNEFLANMSHEIRTPMTAILGYADLLAEESAAMSETNREYLGLIRRQGRHLLHLLNDILDLAKFEAGRMTLEQIPVDIRAVVEDVASLYAEKARAKGVLIGCRVEPDVPQFVTGDPTRLRQIVTNLVSNAVKFTDKGAVSITVEAGTDLSCRSLMVSVSDTGIGIEPEHLPILFESFCQADSSTTRKFGGTGLGLGISRCLADAMGGSIHVCSTPGAGSIFTLSVPLSTPVPQVRLARPDAPRAGLDPARSTEGLRVLIAEDSPDNVRLLEHYLTRSGAVVECVANGEDAVRRFTVDGRLGGPLMSPPPFDVILMDMQMPKMDGYTATELLRSIGCQTPIIAATAHAMPEDRAQCLACGCNGYISKPFDPIQLVSTVRACSQQIRIAG